MSQVEADRFEMNLFSLKHTCFVLLKIIFEQNNNKKKKRCVTKHYCHLPVTFMSSSVEN